MHKPQLATLTEIKEHWNIIDLFEAHEIMDIQDGISRDYNKKNQRDMQKKR